jgi:hypothetical protein
LGALLANAAVFGLAKRKLEQKVRKHLNSALANDMREAAHVNAKKTGNAFRKTLGLRSTH